VLVAWTMSSTLFAQSMGRWHIPSTPAQFFGYGYGPGHQAPMVRARGYRPLHVPRLAVVEAGCEPFCRSGAYGDERCMGSGCWSGPMQRPAPTPNGALPVGGARGNVPSSESIPAPPMPQAPADPLGSPQPVQTPGVNSVPTLPMPAVGSLFTRPDRRDVR